VGEDHQGSVPDDHVAFVDLPEQDRSKVDGPESVVGFFQADELLFEGVGDEEQFVFEPEGAGVGDALDQEVARILERRQLLGIGPGPAWAVLILVVALRFAWFERRKPRSRRRRPSAPKLLPSLGLDKP
jgi:hypothetical protein